MADEGLVSEILELLRDGGLPLAGTCRAEIPAAHAEALSDWLRAGLGGGLAYMARTSALRADPRSFLPWARGAFCVALPYNTSRELSAPHIHRGGAWVSRYAWGRDYHRVLRSKLKPVARLLDGRGYEAKICVDSAPVLERALAVRAGLGFLGKNGMLIHPAYGSYLFLGEVFTDLELHDGEAVPEGCGECDLCLKACPPKALARPGSLDARRCLSAWTIEHRGSFPEDAPSLDGHLFGCDRCQEVCPFNRQAPLSGDVEFLSREGWFAPDPASVAAMSENEWDLATRGSAIRRAGHAGLTRNAQEVLKEKDSPQRHRGTEEDQ